MANGKTRRTKSFRGFPASTATKFQVNEDGPCHPGDILVYDLGRISVIVNSRSPARATKGLIGGAYLDDKELSGWENYSLPLENPQDIKTFPFRAHTGPTFYHDTFTLNQLGGTFLDMH